MVGPREETVRGNGSRCWINIVLVWSSWYEVHSMGSRTDTKPWSPRIVHHSVSTANSSEPMVKPPWFLKKLPQFSNPREGSCNSPFGLAVYTVWSLYQRSSRKRRKRRSVCAGRRLYTAHRGGSSCSEFGHSLAGALKRPPGNASSRHAHCLQ